MADQTQNLTAEAEAIKEAYAAHTPEFSKKSFAPAQFYPLKR